jgi:hypothetical protein
MNKALFLFSIVAIFLTSCDSKEVKNTSETSRKTNEVAVIIDDQLWNGEIGDSVRNKFASPVVGLPQEEPIFTLNQYPVKLLEGFMSNSRNIIVIKKEAKSQFRIEDNEYANPQVVFHVSGKTVQEILDTIQANDSLIISRIKTSEIKVYQDRIKKDSVLDYKKIVEKFNIKINIPSKYRMVMHGKKFIWFKKDITSGNMSLVFYQVPLNSIKDNGKAVNRVIQIRDSIGRIYIHGAVPKTRMITEPAFSPYFSKTKIFRFGFRSIFAAKKSPEAPAPIIPRVFKKDYFFNAFKISSKSSSDLVGAGGGAGASTFLALNLLIIRMTINKNIATKINFKPAPNVKPYLISAAPIFKIKCSKLMPPIMMPIMGIKTLSTNEDTIVLNVAPIIVAIAKSITLPRKANSLNSLNILFLFCTKVENLYQI